MSKLLLSTVWAVTFKPVPTLVHTTCARANSNGLLQYCCGVSGKWYQDREFSVGAKETSLLSLRDVSGMQLEENHNKLFSWGEEGGEG